MGEHDLHRHVQISDDHGAVASADVTITQQTVRTARASLRAAAGHLAPGSRARLVDAVLDLPELHNGGRLEAAFPLGDSETLCRRPARILSDALVILNAGRLARVARHERALPSMIDPCPDK
jgi:hypothetical protein